MIASHLGCTFVHSKPIFELRFWFFTRWRPVSLQARHPTFPVACRAWWPDTLSCTGSTIRGKIWCKEWEGRIIVPTPSCKFRKTCDTSVSGFRAQSKFWWIRFGKALDVGPKVYENFVKGLSKTAVHCDALAGRVDVRQIIIIRKMHQHYGGNVWKALGIMALGPSNGFV